MSPTHCAICLALHFKKHGIYDGFNGINRALPTRVKGTPVCSEHIELALEQIGIDVDAHDQAKAAT